MLNISQTATYSVVWLLYDYIFCCMTVVWLLVAPRNQQSYNSQEIQGSTKALANHHVTPEITSKVICIVHHHEHVSNVLPLPASRHWSPLASHQPGISEHSDWCVTRYACLLPRLSSNTEHRVLTTRLQRGRKNECTCHPGNTAECSTCPYHRVQARRYTCVSTVTHLFEYVVVLIGTNTTSQYISHCRLHTSTWLLIPTITYITTRLTALCKGKCL